MSKQERHKVIIAAAVAAVLREKGLVSTKDARRATVRVVKAAAARRG